MSNYQRLNEPLNPNYPQQPQPQQPQPQQPQQPYAHFPHPQQQQPQQQQYAPYPYPPQQQQPLAPQPQHPYPIQQPLYDPHAPHPHPHAQPHSHLPQHPQHPQQYIVQPTTIGTPGHIGRGGWSDGIFDCFDSGVICLLALFLPFLRWSTTISRLRYLSFPQALLLSTPPFLIYTVLYVYLSTVHPETWGTDSVGSYGTVYFVLLSAMMIAHIVFVVVGAMYRNKLRVQYGIRGNGCEDLLWHWCCGCCAIAQEARHVDRDLGFAV